MAILNKIRQRSLFLILIIGLALFSFVLSGLLRDASGTRLLKREDGLYTPKEPTDGGDFTSGNVPVSVIPEMLEGSNVNPIEVMVSILDMQRSFETQMKIIKNTEEMDRDGANLMRLS